MGTKQDPGRYDCYAKAESDEPMFVLLARDEDAPRLVVLWADEAQRRGGSADKIREARQCAEDMRAWRRRNL